MKAPAFWQTGGIAATLLTPLGYGYALAGRLRRAFQPSVRVTAPVVCVGNLVAGGVGKTPVALSLAEALKEQNRHPYFLTRGYGGTEKGPLQVLPEAHAASQVGDEALLLAEAAPCWVARDRVRGAEAAIAAGADVLVMDDGFQNPSLVKDLSLVVVDGNSGFGNGHLIPAGPLREPVAEGMARADAMIIMGEDRTNAARWAGTCPVLFASLIPDSAQMEELRRQPVVAFAGIGRPEKFFDMLAGEGVDLAACHGFGDHHPYREQDIASLLARAEEKGALLVTTRKDMVRLPVSLRSRIHSVTVSVHWQNPGELQVLLERIRPL